MDSVARSSTTSEVAIEIPLIHLQTDGSCIIDPVSEDFPLVTRTGGSDDFRLKTPHELLGLTETHVNKSKVGCSQCSTDD